MSSAAKYVMQINGLNSCFADHSTTTTRGPRYRFWALKFRRVNIFLHVKNSMKEGISDIELFQHN